MQRMSGNMKAFFHSAAKRYMGEVKVTTSPHVRSPHLTKDCTWKGIFPPHESVVFCKTLSHESPRRPRNARIKSELLATLP